MLTSVSDGLNIGHSEIDELSIPALTYVGGDLVLSDNPHLEDIQLGELVSVKGNLEIANNDNDGPTAISGFPYLSSIGGDLTLSGGLERYVIGIIAVLAACHG